jgi:uncharacterized protein (DUF1330 family)
MSAINFIYQSENSMSVHVIGLFKILDAQEFEEYRKQVGATVELYGGTVVRRGVCKPPFWNQLQVSDFDTFVELTFPSIEEANCWAKSPEYAALLPVRNRAMRLTLFPAMS